MIIRIGCRTAAMLSISCITAQADEQSPARLEPITITATRTERPVEATLASVTVIERAEIERRQAQSVPDVLRGVPGLSMSNDGGLGKSTSVFLRGTNSDHVLVLIDGVRAGSATLGTTSFQDLPIDQIERIEIVRGPRSSLYGSEAIGGVIQIFTRKGGKGFKPYLTFGAGSHSMYKVTGGVSGGNDKAWYNLSGSRLETRGFNAKQGGEPDPDGYSNTSGSARAGYRFDNGLEIEGNLLQVEGDNEFDGVFQNRSTFVQQVLGGRAKYAPTDFWTTSIRAGRTLDESDNYKDRLFRSAFNTQRVSTTWQNDLTLAEGHLLSLGLDYYVDQVGGTTDYALKSRDDKAGFVEYQGEWRGFDAVLGARYDDNEQFCSQPTGNVALGYRFDDGIRVSAGWGSAFKAPTFNQLYFPGFGNPNLLPEQSESVEVGLSGEHLGVRWGVNGYYTWVDQLIGFDASFTPVNIDRAEIRGLESTAATRLWDFDLAATLSVIDPENLSEGANHGNLLPRRPQNIFRFDIDRAVGGVKLGATVIGEGRRFDDLANQQRLAGFVTVDLRANVELYKGLSLEGRLANLLDEHYNTARTYNQDGRNFFLNLRYQPEAL